MSRKTLIFTLILCIISSAILGIYLQSINEVEEISYLQFNEFLNNQEIANVALSETAYIQLTTTDEVTYKTSNPRTDNLKETLLLEGIQVTESQEMAQYAFAQSIFSMIIFFGVFYMVFKRMPNMQNNNQGFKAEVVNIDDLKMDFSGIAGNEEAKDQVQDIVDFIRTPEKYTKVGAKMPKGLIFYGPPGTGKTMMAKALAKEANVPFYSVNGSDFMQMYVGVGASRIRELFKEARKSEKAVIFIDEIDAIGKKRSNSVAGSHDEKDQTLNALLTEMSGFNDEQGIIVIAATNRLELLDDALLRPGRFDRHIQIGYPDQNARKMILSLYLKNKPLDETVDIEKMSEETIYFTGAMLENLVNEAAIEAVKTNRNVLNNEHFEKAFYTVIAGSEKKDRSKISQEERKITAYHEAGHALVTTLIAPQHKVSKVTIIPSTKGAGGFSMSIPKEKMYQTKQDILTQIKISLGGRAAEELIFGIDYVTTGASNDIEKATSYIKDYICKYGMDNSLGLINLEVFSDEKSQAQMLETAKQLMHELYEDTKQLLSDNQTLLDSLANELMRKETLNYDEIQKLVA